MYQALTWNQLIGFGLALVVVEEEGISLQVVSLVMAVVMANEVLTASLVKEVVKG